MNQFIDKEQIKNDDLTRPKYTQELFQTIINNTSHFNNYLDVACGSGQVNLFMLKKNFGCRKKKNKNIII